MSNHVSVQDICVKMSNPLDRNNLQLWKFDFCGCAKYHMLSATKSIKNNNNNNNNNKKQGTRLKVQCFLFCFVFFIRFVCPKPATIIWSLSKHKLKMQCSTNWFSKSHTAVVYENTVKLSDDFQCILFCSDIKYLVGKFALGIHAFSSWHSEQLDSVWAPPQLHFIYFY